MKHAKSLSIQLLFLISLMTCSWMQAAPDVVWGSWIDSSESATDCDVILGEPIINLNDDGGDGVKIRADWNDVTVTMTCCDVVIRGVGENPRLYLEPMNGHTITFCVDGNLSFQGGAGEHPLLIVVRGDGNVIFQLNGCNRLNFIPADDVDAAGVKTFVCMNDTSGSHNIQLCFERKYPDTNPSDRSYVCLGQNCLLTYLAEGAPHASDEFACITFDPTHAGTGRYVLKIDDQAALVVRGCRTDDCGKDQLVLADIDCTVLAGENAVLNVGPKSALNKTRASSQNANLLVLNSNETWTELLEDPFCNLGARDDNVDYNGTFGGVQYGFIVGANATLDILDGSFLDYVSLTTTACVELDEVDAAWTANMIKSRNASALIIDGSHDPSSTPAQINLGDCSALYLRSGVDRFGTVTPITDPDEHPFTIDPLFRTPGAGFTVMHIEGPLNVCGSNQGVDSPDDLRSAIEVLSREVYLDVVTNNGPLFVGGSGSGFLERTFATDNIGDYRQYNAANIMVNNCWNLYDTALKHTDQNHKVLENNDTQSEPTYIGGETAVLKDLPFKERLSFFNSVLLVHTDIAFTGFDLFIPNGLNGPCPPVCASLDDCLPNLSRFYFFYNGKVIDQGSGRNMILGTQIGSTACDGCTVICRDAHLDVMQATECDGGDELQHELQLKTQANDDTINEHISGEIDGQTSIHTIYLGHNSNISIGTNVSNNCGEGQGTDKDGNNFTLTTMPKFTICDNYFSFETRGGSLGLPCTSNVTGQGGIFVDKNGTICLADGKRAFFGTMITISCDGKINIPKECMLFADTVGIADWNLDLSKKQVIVPADQCLAEYTLNWRFVTKDYEGGFCPYEVGDCGECNCGPVLYENVHNLPRVEGIVNQLQIKGSRYGDPAHVCVAEGGIVYELVNLLGGNSAEAPVSVVVLRHNSRLCLGSIERNRDSARSVSRLGTNGVTLIADGNGVVELNEDAIIDGRCSILAGPSFPSNGKIIIQSKKGKQLRMTRNAVFDLSSFTSGQTVAFCGDLQVIMEPGVRVHLGGDIHNEGANIRFEDSASMLLEPLPDACDCITIESCIDIPMANEATIEDCLAGVCGIYTLRPKHVIVSGNGSLQFAHNSQMSVPRGASLSIQSYEPCGIDYTDLLLEILDHAQVKIGDDAVSGFGGSVQVGDENPYSGAIVNFRLKTNGPDARFAIGSQGILSLAVGVVCKNFEPISKALTKVLHNVGNIGLELGNGIMSHNHIYPTSHEHGSLIVFSDGIGSTALYSVLIDTSGEDDGSFLSRSTIQGGGNIGYISPTTDIVKVLINTVNGDITSVLRGGIAKSALHFRGAPGGAFTAPQTFDFLTLGELSDAQPTKGAATAAFSITNNNTLRSGYIFNGVIYRASNIKNLIGTAGKLPSINHTAAIGSLTIGINANGTLRYAVENQ